jgi:hypothetical protein
MALAEAARAAGVPVLLPDADDWISPALRRLAERGLILEEDARVTPLSGAAPILAFNAGALRQALDEAPGSYRQ